MSGLFTPIRLREVEIPNRIVMPPMCQYSASGDGAANDWHLAHYSARAAGGTGLIILEATAVEPGGRITDADLGIWSDGHVPMLGRIAEAVHRSGARAGIQIAHAGRKSTATGQAPVAPSPIAYDGESATPRELTAEEISGIVEAFARGAERANEAGFDLLEIHAAHGYLLSEFLSPVTNRRRDGYGGDIKGRSRMLREALAAARGKWPEAKPVSVRISAVDHVPGGVEIEDSVRLVESFITGNDCGVDIWHVSSGGIAPSSSPPSPHPGFQTPYSQEIKKMTGARTIAVGGITTAELASEIVSNGRADMVALGRELLRNPYWALGAAKELGVDIRWPVQYERAKT